VLRFNRAPIHPNDLLGTLGAGATLCAEHFAAFRPLVAATALGGAAGVVDQVLAGLRQRLGKEYIRIPRDSALTTLGRHVAAVNADLLACLANTRLAAAGDPAATAWGFMTKAHGVDTAHRAAAEVGLIAGALGFEAGHPIAKVRRDLEGLQYADGIHEELYRAAGRSLLNATRSARLRTRRPDRQRGAVSHGATALTTH
jgi:alkylation response protein AidB-like acyl-CoA dehydrogenase